MLRMLAIVILFPFCLADPTLLAQIQGERRTLVHSRYDELGFLECIAYAPDGKSVASGGYDTGQDMDVVKVWDTASGALRYSIPVEEDIVSLQFSPDSAMIAG